MWVASSLSLLLSDWSRRIKIKSNRDRSAAGRLMFLCTLYLLLYLPNRGFAAARIEARALSEVVIPALAIETVCCSITSWIAVRSYSLILSNSSIQHTPMSASTRAPAYRKTSLVKGSIVIAAVSPTPELPLPDVYTPLGAIWAMCLSSWDFAMPGSPIRPMLISPRILKLSSVILVMPPAMRRSSAFLTVSMPNISGAIDLDSFLNKSSSL